MNYYNEYDAKAAAWLRELIKAGLIPAGDVDERSIIDVKGVELEKYTQCHFFAGIAGWSEALRLAGWAVDRPCWSGSCPCQPFSIAGKHEGEKDKRHLWPEFRRLIAECLPPIVFGEQVGSVDGRKWLAGVRTDLEEMAYAVGGADLCAAGVAAPQLRQRLWWVADAGSSRYKRQEREGSSNSEGQSGRYVMQRSSAWDSYDWLKCADGKSRRVEPGSFPLGHGFSARMGRLRGYGNAIVPQCGAVFIKAFLAVEQESAITI